MSLASLQKCHDAVDSGTAMQHVTEHRIMQYNNFQLYVRFRVNCLYAKVLTVFIKDARLFNKPRRRRSPDGSEFRNKFPYFSKSTIENKSFQQLKVLSRIISKFIYVIYVLFFTLI
jgi:hypothetical protein